MRFRRLSLAMVARLVDALHLGLPGHGRQVGVAHHRAQAVLAQRALGTIVLLGALFVVAPMKLRGERSKALVETVDLYPTIAELAGWAAPVVPQSLDGISVAPLLDRRGASLRDAIFHAYPRNVPGRGALVGSAVRTSRYRLVEWKRPGAAPDIAEIELYDYQRDPEETRNLAPDEPSLVAKLRALLTAQGEAKPQFQ
jgi:iduronate 2-sulfatase